MVGPIVIAVYSLMNILELLPAHDLECVQTASTSLLKCFVFVVTLTASSQVVLASRDGCHLMESSPATARRLP